MKKIFITLALCLAGLAAKADNVYTIYPVPQSQVAVEGTTSFTGTVNVIAESGIDTYTKARCRTVLEDHGLTVSFSEAAVDGASNVYLGVNGSGGVADTKATALALNRDIFTNGKYDRHIVSLTDEGGQAQLVIIGENTDATFYGLATLEWMLDAGTANLKCVNIYDYADMQSRGLVEGYYGYPYSVSVKKDLMKFMMRMKMNTYLYGAKSDPYHSDYWKQAYPTTVTAQQEANGWLSQEMIKDITAEAKETKVNFIWAIHPGNSFLGSTTVITDIMSKYSMMYNLGVRQFGVFVDDVSIPSDESGYTLNATRLTQLQEALEKKYNVEGAAPEDTIKPLHFVPQIYCRSFAGSESQFTSFFNALASTPSKITIYTTGYGVWSVPNTSDYNTTASPLGRSVGWWWNYPCNDNADSQIFPMDMYSNFGDMPSVSSSATVPSTLEHGVAIVSNPMQEGEVAKIPLFSVADYAWNTAGFNNTSSWNASFPFIVGEEKAEAYQYLAKYLRYNDPSDFSSLISSFKSTLNNNKPNPTNLLARLEEIQNALNVMFSLETSESESDRLLYKDLKPWLLKLQQMTKTTKALLESTSKEGDGRWEAYVQAFPQVDSISIKDEFYVDALEGMGSSISTSHNLTKPSEKYWTPFLTYLKENILKKFFATTTATKPTFFTNSETATATVPYNTTNGYAYINMTKACTLGEGEYVGICLPSATQIDGFTMADSVAANYSIYYSSNGKVWTKLAEPYAAPAEHIKYVAIANEKATPVSLQLKKANFIINLPMSTQIKTGAVPTNTGFYESHTANYMYDGDYSTYTCIKRNQQSGDAYTLTLKDTTEIGDVRICMGTVNGDYMTAGRVQISKDGTTWTNLPIAGTTTVNYTMSNSNVKKYNDEMSYCDFDGKNQKAKYVRLYLYSPNTSKWLRLYEIEVNGKTDARKYQTAAIDEDGISIEELTDATGYTGLDEKGNVIYYNLQHRSPAESLKFYMDGNQPTDATLSLTTDGETWTEIGALSGFTQTIDLTEYPLAISVKVSWTSAMPHIYEIVESVNADDVIDVTSIQQIGTVEAKDAVKIEDGHLVVDGDKVKSLSLYAVDGRLLYSQHGLSAHNVLPRISTVGTVVLRLTLADGSRTSYKVLMK